MNARFLARAALILTGLFPAWCWIHGQASVASLTAIANGPFATYNFSSGPYNALLNIFNTCWRRSKHTAGTRIAPPRLAAKEILVRAATRRACSAIRSCSSRLTKSATRT